MTMKIFPSLVFVTMVTRLTPPPPQKKNKKIDVLVPPRVILVT